MLRTLSTARHPGPRPSFKPMLEALEDRLAPAGYPLTDLGEPSGFTDSYAMGINNSGQIVGYAFNNSGLIIGANDVYHAVLYSNGRWTDLGVPKGFTNSGALGINNSGQILCNAFNNGPVGPGMGGYSAGGPDFLYSNGQWTALGVPQGFTSFSASAINNSGQIVGDTDYDSSVHSFLYSNGQWTDLGVPQGFTYSYAVGINNSGQILGYAMKLSGAKQPFLYSNGRMTDLGGDIFDVENGMSFTISIVHTNPTGTTNVEVFDPVTTPVFFPISSVPEPSSGILMLGGLLSIMGPLYFARSGRRK